MKRFGFLLCSLLLLMSVSLFAEESVLIDFALLTGDTDEGENETTLIDFSSKAGTSFTEEEKLAMKTSLALENWEVVLAPSSRSVTNVSLSMCKSAPVNDDAKRYGGETVLGVRVHFPEDPFNSWAFVKPPFEIPGYMRRTELQDDGTLVEDETDRTGSKFENGYGVVKNVGVVKSLSINILGSNFPNGLGVVLKDQTGKENNIFLDYLDFDGWKTITWSNPNYINEVRNRELKKYPLYPNATPLVKLAGLMIYKDSSQIGGDFITYIKDISVVYDKAVLTVDRDIDDEALWGILDERETARRNAEFEKLGRMQVLRYLETKKMHVEEEDNGEE